MMFVTWIKGCCGLKFKNEESFMNHFLSKHPRPLAPKAMNTKMAIPGDKLEELALKSKVFDDFAKWYEEVGHTTGIKHFRSAIVEMLDKVTPQAD